MRRFFGSVGWVLASNVGARIVGFGVLAGLTYFISPDELGVYGAIMDAVTTLYTMSCWGVPVVLQRECAKGRFEELGKTITASVLILLGGIFLSMLLVYFYQEFALKYIFIDRVVSYYHLIPLILMLYGLARLPLTVFLGFEEFRLFSLRNLLESALLLVCVLTGVAMAGIDGAIYGLVAAYFLASAATITAFKRILKKYQIKLKVSGLRNEALRIFKLGAPFFIGNTFPVAATTFIVIAVFTTHMGYEEYGFFRAGKGIVSIMAVVPAALRPVTITYISKATADVGKIKSFQLRLLTMAIVVISMLLVIYVEPFVTIAFGEEYLAGAEFFKWLFIANIVRFTEKLMNNLLIGGGHLTHAGWAGLTRALVYTGLLFLLVPEYKITGFLIAYAGSYAIALIIHCLKEFSNYEHEDVREYLTLLALSIATVSSIVIIDYSTIVMWLSYILQTTIVVGYTLAVYQLVLVDQERALALRVLQSLHRKATKKD